MQNQIQEKRGGIEYIRQKMRKKKGESMKWEIRKRLTAFLLTAVMILTMPQMQIAAAEVESPADVGLCIHHTQHTEDCGYTEGEKGTPCGHVHTEDCYAPIKQCVHEHGERCYPVAEDSATENTAEGEPHTCTHECSKESGCITEKIRLPT